MSSSSSTKGTRKTYSFEEREILITLINKYADVEDKNSDPTSMCRRKTAWAKLAGDYNSVVGPHAARSSVQLRRCWENMKACKRNREEKRSGGGCWQEASSSGQSSLDTSASASTLGLPPNVVFEPKASEPFTLQSVSASKALKMTGKNAQRDFEADDHDCRQIAVSNQAADFSTAKIEPPPSIGPMGDCPVENIAPDVREESSTEETHSEEEDNRASAARGTQTSPCSSQVSQIGRAQRRTSSSAQRGEELHVLALSEAQMKVDIAAMQKEEAKCKLEEVRYRKEEAKLRMLFFTYKLDKLKD